MRSALQRNQVTHAQTVDENVNSVSAGTYEVEADNSRADMLASLEVVERTLTSLMFEARNIQIANVAWSAVEMAKSDDRNKQIDAEHTFEIIDSPPQVPDELDQGSQNQTDLTGIPASSATESIDIDQSLAIEFPTAGHEPHKSAEATKRRPVQRAKVAAKRSVSNNRQANSEAKVTIPSR